jgi:hypothetical protein
MTKHNNSTKPQFTVPINKHVLKLIEDRFNGKRTLNFNGKTKLDRKTAFRYLDT